MSHATKIAVFTSDELRDFVEDVIRKAVGTTDKETLTCSEAGRALGMSDETVRNRVKAGLIKRVPNTTRYLIPSSEIDRLLGR